jgi:hypothetical protein
LQRHESDPEILWEKAESLVEKNQGVLVADDSTVDHHY